MPILLTGCAGVTVYSDPVPVTSTSSGRSGELRETTKLASAPLVKFHADVIGEIDVPGRLSIKTAKDGNGNFAYTETPVKIGDQVVITRQPMVGQIKTASVVDAYFQGAGKVLDSVGKWVATAIGLDKVVGPAASSAVGAIPKP